MKYSLALTASAFLLLLGSASTLPLADHDTDLDSEVYLVPEVYLVEGDSSLEVGDLSEGGAGRDKRETNVTGGINREDLGNGGHRTTGAIDISHKDGKHSTTGGISVDRSKIPGVGSNRQVGVNVGYKFEPNKNTHISVGASHVRGNGGRRTSFGAGFRHTFGRK